jgi:hypothetical protein
LPTTRIAPRLAELIKQLDLAAVAPARGAQ